MQVARLFDILPSQLAHFPKSDAVATKEGTSWRAYSTQELLDVSERLALGLMGLGVTAGHKVALCSGNRSLMRPCWCYRRCGVAR